MKQIGTNFKLQNWFIIISHVSISDLCFFTTDLHNPKEVAPPSSKIVVLVNVIMMCLTSQTNFCLYSFI